MRARELRATSTDAERVLWSKLRDRRLGGYKFRRQHPIGPYFADFACVECMLVVELDGGQHFEDEALVSDARRTAVLARAGFHVLRFSNRERLTETEAVLIAIQDHLIARHPHPSPLPQAGEGVTQKEPS